MKFLRTIWDAITGDEIRQKVDAAATPVKPAIPSAPSDPKPDPFEYQGPGVYGVAGTAHHPTCGLCPVAGIGWFHSEAEAHGDMMIYLLRTYPEAKDYSKHAVATCLARESDLRAPGQPKVPVVVVQSEMRTRPDPMIPVRIACYVAENGEWAADGCSFDDGSPTEDCEAVDMAAEHMTDTDGAHLVWLTANVPLPVAREIPARVGTDAETEESHS